MGRRDSDRVQVFVCCEGGSKGCAAEGGEELVRACRSWLAQHDLEDRVDVRRSDCLGHCKAVACEIYAPENSDERDRRALNQTPDDFNKLKKRLLKALGFSKEERVAVL